MVTLKDFRVLVLPLTDSRTKLLQEVSLGVLAREQLVKLVAQCTKTFQRTTDNLTKDTPLQSVAECREDALVNSGIVVAVVNIGRVLDVTSVGVYARTDDRLGCLNVTKTTEAHELLIGLRGLSGCGGIVSRLCRCVIYRILI